MAYAETPITKLSPASAGEYDIFIKRDDLLPFSFGGNKVRIADAFLADMREKGSDALIFYGDRRSNLCRVLANRCAIEGIPSIMIATDEHAIEGDFEPYNSRLIRQFDIPVINCAKTAIAEAVDEAFASLRLRGLKPYYIYGDRTGTGNEGTAAAAYAEAFSEIRAFEKREGFAFDLIVTPYGTGATMAGLICGELTDPEGPKDRILGLSISSRTPERALKLLREGVTGYFSKIGRSLPEGFETAVHLETAYNKGGYGLYDDEVRETVSRMLRSEGIPMDPTYTAKAYTGLMNWLSDKKRAGCDYRGKKLLFLHTGGLPLFFDYLTEGR